jgi:NADPH-dependent 2,4-dienoyl-CoA reductase/sulfur reductase-like enzyme
VRSIVIVGASLAGLSTARALRDADYLGSITVVGAEKWNPYDRPPLSKDFLAHAAEAEDLWLLDDLDADLDVDWRLGRRAIAFDAASRRVRLQGGSVLQADGYVLATGARARVPAIPGRDLPGVYRLRTLDDAQSLSGALDRARRVAIVGGGFIGCEVAATAVGLGLEVTVVERFDLPLVHALGPEVGRSLLGLHGRRGVDFRTGAEVARIGRDSCGLVVQLRSGALVGADLVLIAVGSEADTGWLEGSGLAVADGLVCNRYGATSASGVVAIGDCAAWFDPVAGEHRRLEHWTDAVARAPVAAAELLALADRPPVPIPYFWSDQFDVQIQFAGVRRPESVLEVEAGTLDAGRFVGRYVTGDRVTAVIGVGMPNDFARLRRSLEDGHQ